MKIVKLTGGLLNADRRRSNADTRRFLDDNLRPSAFDLRESALNKIFLLSLIYLLASAITSYAQDWQELKGDHFLVYFTQDDAFARQVLNKAELYYQRISSDLGYPRYSEFWTWDKRVKIYVHPNRDSFSKATNEPGWSEGMADYKNKQIISYAWSSGFTDSLLPHEIAHLVFRDFVGFKGEVPLWLDEGVAQWAEEAKRKYANTAARQLFSQGTLLPLEDMMKLNVRNIKEKTGTDNLVNVFYLQAVSLVGFMIEKYGSNSFTVFCRELRDGKGLEEALKSAYPSYTNGLKGLEGKWQEYLKGG